MRTVVNVDERKLHFKQSLKKLKKKVKQLESQRNKNRSWNHKAELLEAKKQKLYWKDLLTKLDTMTDKDIDEYVQEHTLSTPLSEYEWIEEMTKDEA
jgi:Ni,Fe-hydrogenase I large subunit